MRNVLIEITAYDPATSSPVVLRACAAHAGTDGVYLDGKEWAPVIISGPVFEFSYWNNGQPAPLDISYGAITLILSAAIGSDVWGKYIYDGQNATIWVGDFGTPFTSYLKIFSGKLGPHDPQPGILALPLLGPEASLNKPVLSSTYGGTGGEDGSTDIMGNYKPYALGACVNVAPVLIDPIKWVYQAHGYGACPINAVYEAAYPVEIAATYASYAELIAATIPDGKAAVAPAVGMFRLANEPTGKITADVGSTATVGATVSALMLKAGLSSARIDASVTGTPRGYSLYLTEQETALTLIRDAAFAGGRFLIADGEGKFYLAPIVSTKSPGTLSSERTSLPLVQGDRIAQEQPGSPAYKVRIGHTRVWATHSSNEISPALKQVAANQAALDSKAQSAIDKADAAKAQADLAVNAYNAMVADNVLSRDEKRQIIDRFEGYTAEAPGLLAEALSQGITTERTAYNNAFNTLTAYLNSLSPAYNNTLENTPIVANDFKAAFVNYDVAKQNLVNALANKAAKTAGWTNVSGRPTNLAGLDSAANDKLTGIEAGATVGAPVGTNVGGVPAQDVARSITNFNARNDRNSSPIRSVKMVAGEDLNHTLNKDGSMNLVVRWEWDGNSDDIDGFIITVRQGEAGSGRTGLNSVAQSIFRSR